MAFEGNNITIAPWVSWRVYRTPSEIRCFISKKGCAPICCSLKSPHNYLNILPIVSRMQNFRD